MDKRDPRLTPARPDVAARYLEGQVEAARFVDGEEFEVADGVASMRLQPFSGAEMNTQALKGERFTIYDRNDEGWAWGQLNGDGYVGWLSDLALYPPGPTPTHKVTALRTFLFPGPSIKLPPTDTLPLGARLAIVKMTDAFAMTMPDIAYRGGMSRRSMRSRPISLPWPSTSSARPISGAARAASVSIAPGWCKSH
jgi:hypothetical protein